MLGRQRALVESARGLSLLADRENIFSFFMGWRRKDSILYSMHVTKKNVKRKTKKEETEVRWLRSRSKYEGR